MTYPYERRLDSTAIYTPDGRKYVIDGGGGRWVVQDGEYGNPPIEYITQRGPFQHGESVLSYWLRPRPIQLVVRYRGGSREDYWNHRAELLDILRPNRSTDIQASQHRLRKSLANGAIREILVVPDSTPTFPAPDQNTWDAFGFTDVLRFVANDPTWYDPTARLADFETVTDYVSVDFPPGYSIGSGDYLKVAEVQLAGTWHAYPTIMITGPLSQPKIYNASTGQIIAFTNSLSGGQTLTIDLRYGYKTVVRSDGQSLISFLTEDSDVVSFHLGANPEVTNGINTIYVHGTGQSGATAASLTWQDRYLGI